MRQLAHLNAVKEPKHNGKGPPPKRESRMDAFIKANQRPLMPPLDPLYGDRYVKALFDAGPVSYGGMGAVPISSAELLAWCEGTGTYLRPWEFSLIRRLSSLYSGQLQLSADPNCAPPWDGGVEIQRPDELEQLLARNQDKKKPLKPRIS